jgi:hypothetical protein
LVNISSILQTTIPSILKIPLKKAKIKIIALRTSNLKIGHIENATKNTVKAVFFLWVTGSRKGVPFYSLKFDY